MLKITALSTLCADLFYGTDIIRPGGEALNFAMVASRIPDVQISLIGAIGNDKYGEAILSDLRTANIDISSVYQLNNSPTATHMTYLTPNGDRYYKEDSWNGGALDAFKRLNTQDVDKIKASDVVFCDVYCPFLNNIIELKKNSSFKLAVDFNTMNNTEYFEAISPYIDFFLISGQSGTNCILEALTKKFDCYYNITFAENGSRTYYRGVAYDTPAVKASVVDTTGAGDSYHAGFVVTLMQTSDIIVSMEVGSRLASQVISRYGGY